MLQQIRVLRDEIERTYPGAEAHIEGFASGAATLDVRWRTRVFVLAYSPSRGFGVDELQEGEGFETGYRFASPDFEGAAAELHRLLRG